MRTRGLVFLFLVLAFSVVHSETSSKGAERVDLQLADGRELKNVELVKKDNGYVFVRTNSSLTGFKRSDVRSIRYLSVDKAEAPPGEDVDSKPTENPAPEASPHVTPAPKPQEPTIPRIEVRTEFKTPAYVIPVFGLLAVTLLLAIGAAAIVNNKKAALAEALKAKSAEEKALRAKAESLEARYSRIIEMDAALAARKEEAEAISRQIHINSEELESLEGAIAGARKKLRTFEGDLSAIECGHYRPTFDFGTSEEFKLAIEKVRDAQRTMLKEERAALCSEEWTVNGSASEGKKATRRTLRLMLRAFNGESDAIIARVSWNNIDRMIERLAAVFEAINKLGESYRCALHLDYLSLKERELKLTFEYEAKLKQEKDEQRAIREQMRDEERARREMEDALKQTAIDEARAQKALEQARLELAEASGEKERALHEKISLLEGRLEEALKNKERAISRAQQTRSGHVYIISNIGSFGEMVYKIGMTRRLDPYDRVLELGDASVPFAFDVHGMIYTDDAPTLESRLHKRFDANRVNLVNERKEFFHVSMDEIASAVKEFGTVVELTLVAEAREHRETLERRKARNQSAPADSKVV